MRSTVVFVLAVSALTACGDRPPSVTAVVGTYAAELPATTGPARTVTLALIEGNRAEMRVQFTDGRPGTQESGTWSLSRSGDVRVVLARDGFGPVTSDLTFRFARNTLTAIAFDTLRWSAKGFSLARSKP